ncbi:hypothetical protein SteCoe_34653 [Stentor coeruleus]|uniref:EF-hand domain-containing protein n=1 Tax=Stentor coeruleus TaxID=5963 RepID=A0A1R2AU24_9CILI|nr:hypothetical protein SteCoe_34653 [Stentor coeruleus]
MSNRIKRNSRKSESLDATILRKSYNLCKIEEDPKEIDEEESAFLQKSPTRATPRNHSSLPPITNDSKEDRLEYMHIFLSKLKSKPCIYQLFTKEAVKKGIIAKLRTNFLSLQPIKAHYISALVSPANAVLSEIGLETSLIQEELITSSNSKTLTVDAKSRDTIRRHSVKDLTINTPVSSTKTQNKISALDKSNPGLFERFKIIAGGTDSNHKDYKLTYDNYKEYLLLRYTNEMAELMLKWLYHGLSMNFDGWVTDMIKFINTGSEKHCRLAFELYDINKDKYICTNDAFHIMAIENSTIFDQDLIKIRQAFTLKVNNELVQSRLSTRKKGNKKNKAFLSAEDEIKFKVPPINPLKPEALTLDDFIRIQFYMGKPQIIQDLIKNLTDFDIYETNTDNSKQFKRKKSEEIIEEIIYSFEAREKLQSDPRYGYYKELEKIMLQFPPNYAKLILEKYTLMCPGNKEISLTSLSEVWPRFFGTKNNYINQSFYNFLSGPKHQNITKVTFLGCALLLFNEEKMNQFSFSIYDRNQDGLITCEEINEFFESLNEKSFIYKECLILINEFIASIFGKRHKQLDGIDYIMFKELIPKSILVEEFIKSLIGPSSGMKKNFAFLDKNEMNQEEIDNFKKYTHLVKPVELGDINRRYEEETK